MGWIAREGALASEKQVLCSSRCVWLERQRIRGDGNNSKELSAQKLINIVE